MKKIFIMILIVLLLLPLAYLMISPCIRAIVQGPWDEHDWNTWREPEIIFPPSIVNAFFIHEGMSYDTVFRILGKPHGTLGSGLIREVWYTVEGWEIIVTSSDEFNWYQVVEIVIAHRESGVVIDADPYAKMIVLAVGIALVVVLAILFVIAVRLLKKKGILFKKKQVREQGDSAI